MGAVHPYGFERPSREPGKNEPLRLALTVELLGEERMPRYHGLRSLRASPPRETAPT